MLYKQLHWYHTAYYCRVQEESEEKKESLVRLVLLDLLALKDPLETMVQKAAQ